MRFNAFDSRPHRSPNMISLKWLVAAMCLVSADALQDDLGPQYFRQSSSSPISLKPGYVMKDVVLYLTPSQIKALEATQGLNKVVPFRKANENAQVNFSNDELQKLEAELKKQLERQNIYEEHNSRPVENRTPTPIVEPNTEKPIAFAPQYNQPQETQNKPQQELNYFLPNVQRPLNVKSPESYSYIKFFNVKETQGKPDIQLFRPQIQGFKLGEELLEQNLEIQKDPLQRQQFKWIPYEFATKKTPEQPKPGVIVQSPQWPKHFDQLFSEPSENQQFPKVVYGNINIKESGEKELQLQKGLSDIKFTAQLENYKEQSDYQRFLTKIEQENAVAKAEAIRSSAPVVVKQEEYVTKQKSENTETKYASQSEDQAADYQRFVTKIAKENAVAKAEALGNSSPIEVKPEEAITKEQLLIKHSNIPVLKPFFIPVPHAGVKVSQPYRIPVGILQAVPIVKTDALLKVDKPYLVQQRYLPS